MPMIDPYRAVGRNDPCPCGSGKKFKKCCLNSASSSSLHRVDPAAEGRSGGRPALDQPEEGPLRYDPFTQPDPQRWLAMDEQERIDAVMAYHRRAKINLPHEKVHAIVHAIVETQIADDALPVRRIAQRLMSEGLDRHDAIHAIGSVLMGYMNDLLRAPQQVDATANRDPNEGYFAELESLTAEGWLQSG